MILNKDCYERGCAAYDDRVDEGVVLTNGGEHMKAFPNRQLHGDTEGMDLRDYFAAQALTGAQIWDAVLNGQNSILARDGVNRLAEVAYAVADAMIKARGQRD